MDSCIICFEDNNLIKPQNCNCKIYMHTHCLEKMIKCLNIDCPLCRHKIEKNIVIIGMRHTPNYLYIIFLFLLLTITIFLFNILKIIYKIIIILLS